MKFKVNMAIYYPTYLLT